VKLKLLASLILQKDGRVFASSTLWPNSGQKCHKTSVRLATLSGKPAVLGAVHKRRPQSWGGRFVQCGHFADKGGSSDADVRTFWSKKT